MENILEILKARDDNAVAKANGLKLPLNLKRKLPQDFNENDEEAKKINIETTMISFPCSTVSDSNKENKAVEKTVEKKSLSTSSLKPPTSRIPVIAKSISSSSLKNKVTNSSQMSSASNNGKLSGISTTVSARSVSRISAQTPSRINKTSNLNSTISNNTKVFQTNNQTNSWDIKAKYDSLNDEFENYKKLSSEAIDFLRDYNLQLQEENNCLNTEKNQTKMKLESLESQVEYMKKEITNSSVQKMQLEMENSTTLALINELKAKLDINQQLKEKMHVELSQILSEKEETRCQLESRQFIIDKVETTLSKTQELLKFEKKTSLKFLEENEFLKTELIECQKLLGMQDNIRRRLHHQIQEMKGNIRVMCRIRPFLSSENDPLNPQFILSNNDSQLKIISSSIRENYSGTKSESMSYDFNFDKIFSSSSSQKLVFEEISPLIQSALDGYNICVFAYGQTGSGKTFTMEGNIQDENLKGMIPLSVEQIFESMKEMKQKGWNYSIEVSFIEIYNDQIGDLLSNRSKSLTNSIDITSDGQLTNIRTINVTCPDQIFDLLKIANDNRAVAATNCNEHSSRSHSIFRLKLYGVNELLNQTCQGLVNLIDLAGSERLKESGAVGDRLKETQHINKSLSHLAIVIQALAAKDQHIPFRNCKLTYLLQNSLSGNSKSLMFVNVSPREESFQETVCSLRFAAKVNSCHIGIAKQQKSSK